MSESLARWEESQEHTRRHYEADGIRPRSDAREKLRAFERTPADLEGDVSVLEVGTYQGIVHSLHAERAVGIDPLAAGWEAGRESRAECIGGIGESLPFENDTFDYVFSWNTLDHVLSPRDVLAETRRILRPGGELLLCVNVYDVPRIVLEGFVKRVGTNHPHYFSPQKVRTLIGEAELAIEYERLAGNPVNIRRAVRRRDVMSLGSALCGLSLYQARCRPRAPA